MELKKCPFCGGEAEIEQSLRIVYWDKDFYQVCCVVCLAETWKYHFAADAIEAWNRRVDNG